MIYLIFIAKKVKLAIKSEVAHNIHLDVHIQVKTPPFLFSPLKV